MCTGSRSGSCVQEKWVMCTGGVDCILVYGSTTKGDVGKRSDCILVYGSTTKDDVVKRSDCILVYGSTTKGGVVYQLGGDE